MNEKQTSGSAGPVVTPLNPDDNMPNAMKGGGSDLNPTGNNPVETDTADASLREEVSRTGARIAEVAGSVASDLKNVAREKFDAAVSEVGAQTAEVKNQVAGEVGSVAAALRTAASDLRRGSPQERTLALIADGIADASEAIRDRDLGEMVSGVQTVARRNPLLFLGGAVLLGFAAARFGKASAEGTHAVRAGEESAV